MPPSSARGILRRAITQEAVIETNALSREFGQTKVVDEIDLRIEAGEIFGLPGPNGAGKTTTIKMPC